MKTKNKVQRKPHQVFLEDDLINMAAQLSRQYTIVGKTVFHKPQSASWYIRNALVERMVREGKSVGAFGLTDYSYYDTRRTRQHINVSYNK